MAERNAWRVRALHIPVIAAFSLFFIWLYARPLVEGTYLAESDLYEQYLPMFLAGSTAWTSYEFAGFPAFADAQNPTAAYIPHLVFGRVVSWWTAMTISAHVLAAVFTYAYVAAATGSRAAAAFSGLAYAVSEALIERIAHQTILHAIAWLPLVAWSIDRVRQTSDPRWIACGAFGLSQTLLAGHPQMALYTYYVAVAYALVGGYCEAAGRRYYIRIGLMVLVGALLTGIKAIPILEASTMTARQETSFSQFAGHANSPAQMLSAIFPKIVHEGREAPTYVGMITLMLALAGTAVRRFRWQARFWAAIAVGALLLGAGASTPLAHLAYYLPGYAKFRVGARHLFLAALGLSVLAGFALAEIQARQLSRRAITTALGAVAGLVAGGALLILVLPGAFRWESRALAWNLPGWPAAVWVQFAVAAVSAIVVRWTARTTRFGLAVSICAIVLIADALHAIPYAISATGLGADVVPAAAAEQPSVHAAQLARELRPQQQRLAALGGTAVDPVVPAAFARVWQIPTAGGYNPMILARHADLALMDSNGVMRAPVLAGENVALDLLAVKYLLVRDADYPEASRFASDGFEWDRRPLELSIGRTDCGHRDEVSRSLPLPVDVSVSAIGLVTYLRCSEDVPQGAEVLALHVVGDDGEHVASLRAGFETAETGLFDPALRARAKHQRARVFGDSNSPRPLAYFTRIDLPEGRRARRLELRAPGTGGWTVLQHLSVADASGRSHPLMQPAIWLSDRDRWREVRRFATSRRSDRRFDESARDEQPITVFENLRARPRAWFVEEVIAANDSDALGAVGRSLLPDGRHFDPVRQALVHPGDLPLRTTFPEGGATATVESLRNGHIRVAASTHDGGFLVVSETYYPGWRARLDGQPARVHRTNVGLLGVLVPGGNHTIDLEFVSSSYRAGWAVSLAGACACGVLLVTGAARRRRATTSSAEV